MKVTLAVFGVLVVGVALGAGAAGGHRPLATVTVPAGPVLWITGVHVEQQPGARFPHIVGVRTVGRGDLTVAQVVDRLNHGATVLTRASPPGRVYVNARGYLETVPDAFTANNLLALPHY